MKFSRNTHDKDGNYREEFKNIRGFQQKVWDTHGDIVHMLDSSKAMSFQDLLDEIRNDETNYIYTVNDLDIWMDGSLMPEPKNVALGLVRCIEAGFVEIVSDDYSDENKNLSTVI